MKQTIKKIWMVYQSMFRYSKALRLYVPLHIMIMVAIPLMESAIPAAAIALLSKGNVKAFFIGMCGIILFSVFMKFGNIVCENRISIGYLGTRLEDYTAKLLKKSLTMDYCNVESAGNQKILGKGMQSVSSNWSGVEGLARYSFTLMTSILAVFTYGTIMFTVHWSVLFIIFIFSIINYFLNRHAVKFSAALEDDRTQAFRVINTLERQGISLSYGKDIRIYHVEHWFGGILDKQIGILKSIFSKQELRWFFPTMADQIGTFLRDFVLYAVLIGMVLSGKITVAEFTFYVGVVAGFSHWLNELIFKVSNVMDTSLSTGYYLDSMNIKDVFKHGEGEHADCKEPATIEFKNVSFRYDEEGENILSNVSFRMKAGEKIALVGSNGAGKTTIVKLLCGFYLPTEGEVLINGVPTSEYDMDTYRDLISPVFQDGFISAFTVAANIAGGTEQDIDYKKVRECLKKANIWEKIESLPKKENTYVSQVLEDEGVEFSGGEVQKLLIARALYKDGRILILDEPTSALDPIAESQIYEKYNDMADDKTALFISHRLASTRFCDRIIYLENGSICEEGSHEELLSHEGAYAKMFDIQSHYYKEEVVDNEEP